MSDQLYCSVDLELTGFDPERDQILEIGFAFFRLTKHGAEITEEWSQVFKPSVEVHPKILGLTGITADELSEAPQLQEFHSFLQEKLGGATLVCHNVAMDVKFLEAFGLKLSGQYIDTLDLVQFILPTHHSYNLENLMHYFNVEHGEAHRALGDAKATIAVLEKLLRVAQSFPKPLQEKMRALMQRLDVSWQPLFLVPLSGSPAPAIEDEPLVNPRVIPLESNTVVVDSLIRHQADHVAKNLQDLDQSSLLVVPNNQSVMDLWRRGLVHGVFRPSDVFDNTKFEHLLDTNLTVDQGKFCLKVLVWLHTNWQTEVILDLNLSFFGGQFRSLITGASTPVPSSHVLACDYQTFMDLASHPAYRSRQPVIFSLHEFEQGLTRGQGHRISWNGAIYLLKSIYNPETDFGNKDLAPAVIQALAGADLFFGIVSMEILRHFKQHRYITVEMLVENDRVYNRLLQASKNFLQKLELVVSQAPSVDLSEYMQSLETFFAIQNSYVSWVEITESNVGLHKQPLDIAPISLSLFSNFRLAPTFIESLPVQTLLHYYLARLGLVASFVELSPDQTAPVMFHIQDSDNSHEAIAAQLHPEALPAVVTVREPADAKEFYNSYYQQLRQYAAVMAQGYSGGGTKMLRNFAIKPNSLLLVTAPFLIRSGRSVSPRTLVVAELPKVDSSHPYTAALLKFWQDRFPDLQVLLSIEQFLEVVGICYSPKLARVVLFSASNNSHLLAIEALLQSISWAQVVS